MRRQLWNRFDILEDEDRRRALDDYATERDRPFEGGLDSLTTKTSICRGLMVNE